MPGAVCGLVAPSGALRGTGRLLLSGKGHWCSPTAVGHVMLSDEAALVKPLNQQMLRSGYDAQPFARMSALDSSRCIARL